MKKRTKLELAKTADPEQILRSYIAAERDMGRLTQQEVSKKAGLSVGFMSDWMNMKRGISVVNFCKLCNAVDVKWSVEY